MDEGNGTKKGSNTVITWDLKRCLWVYLTFYFTVKLSELCYPHLLPLQTSSCPEQLKPNYCHLLKIGLDISFHLSPFLTASSSLMLLMHTFTCTGNLGSLKYLIGKVIMSFTSQGILWVRKCYFYFCALTVLVWHSRNQNSRILKHIGLENM